MADPSVQVVELLNKHRTERSLPAFSALNVGLVHAASKYAALMLQDGFFSHTGPDGSTPQSRLFAEGVRASYSGENIAAGYPDAAAVVAAWLASPGHRANIEDPHYTHVGIGLAGTLTAKSFRSIHGEPRAARGQNYPTYWVADFAQLGSTPPAPVLEPTLTLLQALPAGTYTLTPKQSS